MSIQLDGRPIESFGIKILHGSSEPALPQTRDRTVEVLGRHGAIDFGADLDAKPFNYSAVIKAESVEVREKLITDFVDFLLDENGRPRTMRMTRNKQPDKYYNVRYSGAIDVERVVTYGFFELPLTAFDPKSYAEPDEFDTSLNYDDGHEYDD